MCPQAGVGRPAVAQQEARDLRVAHLGCDVQHRLPGRAVTLPDVTAMLSPVKTHPVSLSFVLCFIA